MIADRFELLSEAGRGAMGSVHRAVDRTTGGQVAVKVVHLERDIDLVRFNRECGLLATVRHPNIVDYVAHGEGDGMHWLAQEWVDGITLRTQLRTVGTTAAEGVTMARGLAEALGAAHALGVVHRDVKPENVVLAGGEATRVKLVDFGIARLADPDARMTRTGVMIGTPSYMAPEQAKGLGQIGPAADVWALGCVLFECLGGRQPFGGRNPTAIRAKVILDEPPDLTVLCPEAPAGLIALIDRMLAKAADRRPPSGHDVAAALRALPLVADGPRRRSGGIEPPTVAMPLRPDAAGTGDGVQVLVFFTSLESTDARSDHGPALVRVADAHDLDLHVLDDGSAVLAARARGRDGARAAAAAARELQRDVPGSALSVVGVGDDHRLADAIDRGATELEHAAMGVLFGDIVAGAAPVHVDAVIAELIEEATAPVPATNDEGTRP